MDVINPNDFTLETLYISSALNPSRMKMQASKKMSKREQELLFDTICEGLIETWNNDEESCIEALKVINTYVLDYEIPNSEYSESIVEIIIQLLGVDSIIIVKNALLVISNAFSQEKYNLIEKLLIEKDITRIIHEALIKWGTQIFVEILLVVSNMVATSEECRDSILQNFSSLDIETLISSIIAYTNCSVETQERYKKKCKFFLKKLCQYELKSEVAVEVFNLLTDLKDLVGYWIFEPMGFCAKWIKEIEVDPDLIEEAFELLSSDCDEYIRSALIFIGFATEDINENIIALINSDNDKISEPAFWTVYKFLKSKGPDAVQICLECDILQIMQEVFSSGSYKKRVEISYCLCYIIRYSSLSEKSIIISMGLFSDLAEMIPNCGDQDLSILIIQTISSLFSHEEIVPDILRICDEKNIYEIVSEEESKGNQILSKASDHLLNILESIE